MKRYITIVSISVFVSTQLTGCIGEHGESVRQPIGAAADGISSEARVFGLGPVTIQTGSASSIVRTDTSLSLALTAIWSATDVRNRVLTIEPSNDANGGGVSLTLRDDAANVVLRLVEQTGIAPDGSTRYHLEEWTPSEHLVLDSREAHGIVTERYVINSNLGEWSYAPGSAAELAAATEYKYFYQASVNGARSELVENSDGIMIAKLLANPGFQEWIRANTTSSTKRNWLVTPACDAKCIRKICTVAGLCARLKCMAGGLANFLCDACIGVSAACVIRDVGCWAFGGCE